MDKNNLIKLLTTQSDFESRINIALNLYFDIELNDVYHHKKKCMCIALLLKDIECIICKPKIKKNNFLCFSKQKLKKISENDKDKIISKYLYDNKFPSYIDELLQLYRKRNIIKIDEMRLHSRCNDLFVLLKYNNIINNQQLMNMTYDDKINLIRQILSDIEQI